MRPSIKHVGTLEAEGGQEKVDKCGQGRGWLAKCECPVWLTTNPTPSASPCPVRADTRLALFLRLQLVNNSH